MGQFNVVVTQTTRTIFDLEVEAASPEAAGELVLGMNQADFERLGCLIDWEELDCEVEVEPAVQLPVGPPSQCVVVPFPTRKGA